VALLVWCRGGARPPSPIGGAAVLLCFAVVIVCAVVAELMSQSNRIVRTVVQQPVLRSQSNQASLFFLFLLMIYEGYSLVGDNHKDPLKTGGKPIYSQNNKNTNELTNCKMHLTQSRPGDRGPRPWQPQWPIKRSAPTPLGRNSTSLHGPGAVPPKLRRARGSAAPAPTPLTGALNALTRRGRPGQGRIPATPAL
jgi:hypothetical protein